MSESSLGEFLPDICPDLDLTSPGFPCVSSVFQFGNGNGDAESPQSSSSPLSNNDSVGVKERAKTNPSYSEEDKLVLKTLQDGPQVLAADTQNLVSIYNHWHQVRNSMVS